MKEKEKDLDKHLDNLIIDGLIKEAEQDNADFEAAMRNISDDDFESIIASDRRQTKSPTTEDARKEFLAAMGISDEVNACMTPPKEDSGLRPSCLPSRASTHKNLTLTNNSTADLPDNQEEKICCSMTEPDELLESGNKDVLADETPVPPSAHCPGGSGSDNGGNGNDGGDNNGGGGDDGNRSAFKSFRLRKFAPWLTAAAVAVAVVLVVIVAGNRRMNGRLCDNAIYATEAFFADETAKAYEIADTLDASPNNPNITNQGYYKIEPPKIPFEKAEYLATAEMPDIKSALPGLKEIFDRAFDWDYNRLAKDADAEAFKENALALAVAYLRLHEKGEAVNVLRTIAEVSGRSSVGMLARNLIRQLDPSEYTQLPLLPAEEPATKTQLVMPPDTQYYNPDLFGKTDIAPA